MLLILRYLRVRPLLHCLLKVNQFCKLKLYCESFYWSALCWMENEHEEICLLI